MTLVLSVQSRNAMWVLADRRLTRGHHVVTDDAIKLMTLDTADGTGILAYAGLGMTPGGTQPSEWMSAALRGRGGLSFEQALGVLSEVANRELPRHLRGIAAHFIVVPAFVQGVGARLYSIGNAVNAETGEHWYRFTSYHRTAAPASTPARMAVAGSGALYLDRTRDRWERPLRRLVKAHSRGRVPDNAVADHLARLNFEVHQNVADGTVGYKCVVIWRRRGEPSGPASGGGEHRAYTGVEPEPGTPWLPSITNGMDAKALGEALFDRHMAQLTAGLPFGGGVEELKALLAALPDQPDETLR